MRTNPESVVFVVLTDEALTMVAIPTPVPSAAIAASPISGRVNLCFISCVLFVNVPWRAINLSAH